MFTAIQRMQQTPICIMEHLFISMYFASAQKCVTELHSVTNDPMLRAKSTVQHTTLNAQTLDCVLQGWQVFASRWKKPVQGGKNSFCRQK